MQTLQSHILRGREWLPEPTPQAPQAAVIFLHGVGSNGDDLLSLAPLYHQTIGGSVAYLSPNAPQAWDAAPMPEAYQWFSIRGYDPTHGNFMDFLPEWGRAVQEAQTILDDFIAEQAARFGIDESKIALVGFSQGTMMSLYNSLSAAQQNRRFAAIVGYSGALLGQDSAASATNPLPPYLLLHGEADDVVPCAASHKAYEFLQSIGAEVQIKTYPNLPHAINEEGIQTAAAFCKKNLAIA